MILLLQNIRNCFFSVLFVLLTFENTLKETCILTEDIYFPAFTSETYFKLKISFSLENANFIALKHPGFRFLCLFIKILRYILKLPTNFFLLPNMSFIESIDFVNTFLLELKIVLITCFFAYKILENEFFGDLFR